MDEKNEKYLNVAMHYPFFNIFPKEFHNTLLIYTFKVTLNTHIHHLSSQYG